MKIIEILNGAGIESYNLQSWIKECKRFTFWYCKAGTQEIDEVQMEKAYLKLDYKIKQNDKSKI
jgi:hypothetical protein